MKEPLSIPAEQDSVTPEVQSATRSVRLKVASIVGAGTLVLSGCATPESLAAECDERPESAETFSMNKPLQEDWMRCESTSE